MTRKYIFLFSFCSLLTLAADLFAQPATPKQDPQAVLQSVCQSLIQQVDSEEFQKAYLPLEEKRDLLILVDKEHALPSYYKPDDLVRMPRGFLRQEAAVWFAEMEQDARKEGIYLFPVSTYRPYVYQWHLKRRTRNPDQVADPGHSQHQLGTAIDFNTTRLNDPYYRPALEWLKQYAGKYGFSLSFPKGQEEETGYPFEPWHYRYITKEGVALQNKFFGGSQHKMLVFLNMCLWNKPDSKTAIKND